VGNIFTKSALYIWWGEQKNSPREGGPSLSFLLLSGGKKQGEVLQQQHMTEGDSLCARKEKRGFKPQEKFVREDI